MDTGIRIGRVSSIDYDTGMMQVVYPDKGKAVTSKLPYANFNDEYHMPKIGQQVLVAHLSNGSSRGIILGKAWNKKNRPAEGGEQLYRKELSKIFGVAYVRYDDETGEYLIKVPNVKINGINKTDIEGPEVNIAANNRTSLESPEHTMKIRDVFIEALASDVIEAMITSDIKIVMDLADLEALILNIKLETLEDMELKAGKDMRIQAVESVEMQSGNDSRYLSQKNIKMGAGKEVELEDNSFATTLTNIMERLEAIDGDTSARK